ncbi:MAG: DUF2791 family P-loop domain-containing protein [Fimbriimonadia bacterium]
MLADFEGSPIVKTEIKARLKEVGQLQGYDLSHPKNRFLAPERILLLAQLYRACECKGWVVMFDEVERLAYFPRKQRIEAYRAIGWWRRQAEQGSGIYPVFAFTPGAIDEMWRKYQDDRYLDETLASSLFEEHEDLARHGLDLLANCRIPLKEPDDEQLQRIYYAIRELYGRAYDWAPPDTPSAQEARAFVSVRSQIRRWITEFDLNRVYGRAGEIVDEGLIMDTTELSEDQIASDDDDSAAE